MPLPPHPDYRSWIVTHADPRHTTVCAPAPAIADVEFYDGSRALVDVEVVAHARGLVCVRQDVGGRHWLAWVDAARVRRI